MSNKGLDPATGWTHEGGGVWVPPLPPRAGAAREPQAHEARSSVVGGSALTSIKMALRCLEEIEPTIMHAKRRKIPNFNEQSERETQLSAARVALDQAITLIEPNPGDEPRPQRK